jgi:glycosyltransferase involved in cell wall biosynthesis
MTSLRVLVVVEQLRRLVPGGIGTTAKGLLRGLRELDAPEEGRPLEIELMASRPTGSVRQGPVSEDPVRRWGWPVRSSPLPAPMLTRAWDHRVLGAPAGFDVVHSVTTAGPPLRRRSPAQQGAPAASVATVHDLAWRRFPEATTRRGRAWHEASLGRALRHADALVVPSLEVASDLAEAGSGADRMRVIPWGADHLPPPDEARARALLARAGVAGPYLLSVGTLEPRKNLERLVQAVALAQPELPEPWPLVLVGPSGWGDVAATLATGRRVQMVGVGSVSEEVLAGLYANARLLAYVPLTEGYGLPPVEAMAAGLPVLASSGVPSVDPDEDGTPVALVVDPFDVDEIAGGLVRAATDDALRSRLRDAGAARAAARTWRRVAEAHVGLWRELR